MAWATGGSPSDEALPQKQKSSATGVEIGQRQQLSAAARLFITSLKEQLRGALAGYHDWIG